MSKFISQYDKMEENLLSQISADSAMTAMWLEDTLLPSVHILMLKSLVYELIDDLNKFEELKGVSEKTKVSRERLNKMEDYCFKIDKIASQNCQFQLVSKHISLVNSKLMAENKALKDELEAVKKAFEAE